MILNDDERLDDLQINNLYIIQNKNDYCFTSDSVALANFARVPNNGRLIDLCSGSGVVGILMSAKNSPKDITLVEIQEYFADMSRRSIEYNHLDNINVINQPLQGIHKIIGSGVFDTVVCNPPYKQKGKFKLNVKDSISIARHELTVTLEEVIVESSKLLKFGGDLYILGLAERLSDIITLLRKYGLEPKQLHLLQSNGKVSSIIVKAKKGGKNGITISL